MDEEGRFLLIVEGSLSDIAKHESEMRVGDRIIVYMTGEFEVVGRLEFQGGCWRATPDWSTIKYLDE